MVQIAIPYAYGCTICVYAYGMKYAYGTQQFYPSFAHQKHNPGFAILYEVMNT